MRNQILKKVLNSSSKNILLELPTGTGKTYLAIEKIKQLNPKNILIIIPRNILKDNWNKEIKKWGGLDCKISYSTYVSIPKNVGNYDAIIFDEAHHLSERCRESLKHYTYKNSILLSATVNKNLKKDLYNIFRYEVIKVTAKEAIDNEVLPEPTIYLVPLNLDNTHANQICIKHPKGKIPVKCLYKDRWKYLKDKNIKLNIYCTQKEYINILNEEIEWYKQKTMRSNNIIFKNKWLNLCSQRLNYLSSIKNPVILEILKILKNYKTLTFCTDIKQTEILGKYCINSKNKSSEEYLNMFNNNKIKHITACNSLNEGINLNSCKVGIFANINASELLVIQRIGRILRHNSPVLIIPFYKNTREEELVINILENFNKDNIKIITDLKDLKL